jgi:hypothetical protein
MTRHFFGLVLFVIFVWRGVPGHSTFICDHIHAKHGDPIMCLTPRQAGAFKKGEHK